MTKPNETPEIEQDQLTPEQKQVHLDAMKDTFSAQLRAAVLSEGKGTAAAERNLHYLLSRIIDRVPDDPEMVGLVARLLGELGAVSSFGDSQRSLGNSARDDLKAVLIGATMTSHMYRDETSRAEQQPQEHIKHVRHFLDLVKKRVGYVDQGTGDTHVRMTVQDDQANDRITFSKGKKQ